MEGRGFLSPLGHYSDGVLGSGGWGSWGRWAVLEERRMIGKDVGKANFVLEFISRRGRFNSEQYLMALWVHRNRLRHLDGRWENCINIALKVETFNRRYL